MNYYDEIKKEFLNQEITRKIKDYSKNRADLNTYYHVGKLLSEAGKHYGAGIIKEYSKKLTKELGKGYTESNLKYFRQYYYFANRHTVCDKLTWSHYRALLSVTDDAVDYYIKICIEHGLSVRELKLKIQDKEYERLPATTKNKLIMKEQPKIEDLIKNPIVIKNNDNYEVISEKILQKLILENIENFMKELGNSFCFIGSEYKIKLGDRYNYIDLLLFNYEYNCFVVIELKITELKKEHIGQIQVYMNYIDNNLKNINQNKTIGIIICKKDNRYVIEYCSDERIIAREYMLL